MNLLTWIVVSPLIGLFFNLLIRPKKSSLAGLIASGACLLSFAFSAAAVYGLYQSQESTIKHILFSWIEAGSIYVPFALEITPVTGLMTLIVTGVGFLIHLYSMGYMSEEKNAWRFFSYLNLFIVAMLTLVLSSNLVGVFLGWEGVGLCSYLLIGYWYKEPANTHAGMKAFITNRIGDLGFFITLFVAFAFFGTADVQSLIQIATRGSGLGSAVPEWAYVVFALGLLWASTGKSAQVPLYVWLPDAMAGPTPVSALIHAATMVTSGLVVITRVWPVFSHVEFIPDIVFFVGIVTAWLAALMALGQNDIKKVLAYSTVSQLGFMFAALGAGSPAAAFFHVVTHACFKALLFLGAGSVIHGMHHEQDMWKMGGLRKKMAVTHWTYLIACAAIAGFPLLSGFFSKDMILAKVFISYGWGGYFLLLGAAVLTAFYMFRSYSITFWGEARSEKAIKAHESPWTMCVPLIVLAVLSLGAGFVELPHVMGHIQWMSHWVESSWYGQFRAPEIILDHSTEWILMGVATLLSLGSAFFAFKLYRGSKKEVLGDGALMRVSRRLFYVDELYEYLFCLLYTSPSPRD